jgi:hypothetical protein
MPAKPCAHTFTDGRACQANPMRSGRFCFFHSPDSSDEAAEARRLGGLRRRREKTVANAYEVAGLETVEDIRRVLESAVLDALSLDNTPARGRLLIAVATAAARLLEPAEEGWD